MDMNLQHDGRAHGDDRHQFSTTDVPSVRVARPAAIRPVAAPLGAGWYHDAAIESARQSAIEDRCNPYGAGRP